MCHANQLKNVTHPSSDCSRPKGLFGLDRNDPCPVACDGVGAAPPPPRSGFAMRPKFKEAAAVGLFAAFAVKGKCDEKYW